MNHGKVVGLQMRLCLLSTELHAGSRTITRERTADTAAGMPWVRRGYAVGTPWVRRGCLILAATPLIPTREGNISKAGLSHICA
jgi:hypothetical protein